MTSMYFPLRTNVHYWDVHPPDLDLEARLKLSVLLYDRLTFDEGGYVALVGPEVSLDIRVRDADQVPEGFFEAHSPPEGGEFSVFFNDLPLTSPAQRRYQISFRRILQEAGLVDPSWAVFMDLDFTEAAAEQIKQLVVQDLKQLHDGDRDTLNLRVHMLASLNHDWIMASLHGWDLIMDPSHEELLKRKLSIMGREITSRSSPVDLEIVFPRLPDLSQVSWDQVLETRQHPSVVEFRRQLAFLSQEAREAYLAGESVDAIRYHVLKWRDDQLIQELEARLATGDRTARKIGISLFLVIGSFVPVVGPIFTVVDAAKNVIEPLVELARDRRSTIAAFIRER